MDSAAFLELTTVSINMCIYQLKKDGPELLEQLTHPINANLDSADYARDACAILSDYARVAGENGAALTQAHISPELSRVQDMDFIGDRLRVYNALELSASDTGHDMALMFFHMLSRLGDDIADALLINMDGESLSLAVVQHGLICYMLPRCLSVSHAFEAISGPNGSPAKPLATLDDSLAPLLNSLKRSIAPFNIDRVYANGPGFEALSARLGAAGGIQTLEHKHSKALWRELLKLPEERLALRFQSNSKEALAASLHLLVAVRLTSSEIHALTPPFTRLQALMHHSFSKPTQRSRLKKLQRNSALASARILAHRLGLNLEHSLQSMNHAKRLFEALKKHHGMNARQSLILELAACLRGAEREAVPADSQRSAFHIIAGYSFVSLSEKECLIVAAAATQTEYDALDQVLLSKLRALLELAEALDMSNTQKASRVKLSAEPGRLMVAVVCEQSFELERRAFERASKRFERCFGLLPELSVDNQAIGINLRSAK